VGERVRVYADIDRKGKGRRRRREDRLEPEGKKRE